MVQSISEQIEALRVKQREENKTNARANLVKVVTNKNSTDEEVISACGRFVGTHLAGRQRKKAVVSN